MGNDITQIRQAHKEACAMVSIFRDICEVHKDEDTTKAEAALNEARYHKDKLEDYLRKYDMDFTETMASLGRESDAEFARMVDAGVIN
jgi:hypothetical protein